MRFSSLREIELYLMWNFLLSLSCVLGLAGWVLVEALHSGCMILKTWLFGGHHNHHSDRLVVAQTEEW